MLHFLASSIREEIGERTSAAARVLMALRMSQSWLKEKAIKLSDLEAASDETAILNLSKVLLILLETVISI